MPVARPSSDYPTQLELEMLKILWQQSPLSVQQVREALEEQPSSRTLTHSSVITVLNIMVRKKYLKRTKHGRAFCYQPLVTEQQVNRGMLGDMVNRVFDGSAKALMLELLEGAEIDAKELNEIRRLVNRKAKEQAE
jgi:BlaI family penicillinase repressor